MLCTDAVSGEHRDRSHQSVDENDVHVKSDGYARPLIVRIGNMCRCLGV